MPPRNRPGEIDITQVLNDLQVRFDIGSFDDLIESHGVKMVHMRAFRCPGGLSDVDDIRRPEGCHLGCSNGFLYVLAGEVNVLFSGNSNNFNIQETGVLDGSQVNVTMPRQYCDGTPIHVANFDRLYLAEKSVIVPDWQLVENHASGSDRFRRPPVAIQDLIDSVGMSYKEGVDFEVHQSGIKWLTNHRPGTDPATGKGRIYAVRFLYRPYFYISKISHEIRVTQADVGDEVKTVMMPQAVTLQREYFFEGSEDKDPEAKHPESWRQAVGPREGSFGPR